MSLLADTVSDVHSWIGAGASAVYSIAFPIADIATRIGVGLVVGVGTWAITRLIGGWWKQ